MYRASLSMYKIEKREILKETEKQVKFNGFQRVCTEAKVSSYHSWHKTFNEAFDAIEKHIYDQIKRAEYDVELNKDELNEFHQNYSKEAQNGLG
jgi:hypothetical protein